METSIRRWRGGGRKRFCAGGGAGGRCGRPQDSVDRVGFALRPPPFMPSCGSRPPGRLSPSCPKIPPCFNTCARRPLSPRPTIRRPSKAIDSRCPKFARRTPARSSPSANATRPTCAIIFAPSNGWRPSPIGVARSPSRRSSDCMVSASREQRCSRYRRTSASPVAQGREY